VRDSTLSFVIVPTPSNTLGGFSLRYVLKACDQIGAAVRQKRGPHTVAVVSTVLPGSSDQKIVPALQAAAGRKIGEGLGYCYNPVFIALGDIVAGFEKPDYLLIGEADRSSGDAVLAAHQTMARSQTPIARMRPVEAEITKIASNTHETMRVAFANMLFCACTEVPGADVDRITEALSHRMGKRFFKGAVPYGGPCWPRDNRALSAFLEVIGTPPTMPRAVDTFNAEHGLYVLRKVLEVTAPGDAVGVLGLSYKTGTPCIDRSFGVDLAGWLAQEGRRVRAWDPLATDLARQALGDRVAFAVTAEQCLRESRLAVLVNPLKEMHTIDWSAAGRTTVLDCWRCLPASAQKQVGAYRALGRGPQEGVRTWLAGHAGGRLDVLGQ
jgi:UDPglucose 6-dehydrogenase